MKSGGIVTVLCVLLACAACVHVVTAAMCGGSPPTPGAPNTAGIYSAAPVFVKSAVNGTLWKAGEGDDAISLVHVYGTPYSMGFAYGTLLKDEMTQFFPRVWRHLLDQVEDADFVKNLKLPKFMEDLLAAGGLDVALDAMYEMSKPYTPDWVEPEQRGIADATGTDIKLIRRIHLIGELTKGRCSMFGMWGDATSDGRLLQLRALDWDADGPFQDYPVVVVYHPDPGYGYAFANVGWSGWIGSITGFSSNQLAISEIGVYFSDATWGDESYFGTPFVYLLRNILQYSYTVDDAASYMASAQRTCRLLLGVGDGKMGYFRGFQYSHSVLNEYDPLNLQPLYDWHPRINNTVYWGMDWLCPGYNRRLAQEINSKWGHVTPENTISDIVAYTATGNLHVAVYDLTNQAMYVANARGTNESGNQWAYERQYVFFDMAKLFAEPRPKQPTLLAQ